MTREIVLDTETTGRDANAGDRIVEIGCVELINHIPTGRHYHTYLNPQRAVEAGALAVHGLSNEFLAGHPLFAEVADTFAAFIGDAKLVIHNAAFDMSFLNAEFTRLGRPALPPDRALDTLQLARRKHPGASNSLDALCSRYGIDNSKRTKHGALLDAEILAEVYIELLGGKQADLGLGPVRAAPSTAGGTSSSGGASRAKREAVSLLSNAEREAHRAFVKGLGGSPLWGAYLGDG